MNKIETVALIGLGAIGASYLAQMSENIPMEHIRVIASGDRARRYKNNGVLVNGKKYLFPVCEPSDETGPADLIIFAVKYNSLKQAIADAKNQIGSDTTIMSFLNGITSEREISDVYGAKHTLLSTVIKIAATRTEDSTVNSKLGVIQFGEAMNKEGEYSEDVKRVKEFFDRSGISYEIHEDMKQTLWKKFMLNVGMNQTSAVLRFPYGLMRKIKPAQAIMIAAMEEVVSLAALEKVRLTGDDIKDVVARMKGFPPDGRTSMLQDIESLRPTEVGMLGDAVVTLGRLHGLPVPVNEMLSCMIHAIEESHA
jgi:2-dehydropantoate 2-reductase